MKLGLSSHWRNGPPDVGTPIDWDSDHAQDLVGFWPCWDGSGFQVEDLVHGNHGRVSAGATIPPTWGGSPGNAPGLVPKLAAGGGGNCFSFPQHPCYNLPAFTIACSSYTGSATGGWPGLFQSRNGGQNGFQFGSDTSNTSLFQPHITVINSGGSEILNKKAAVTYAFPFTVPRTFVSTWDGTTGRIWTNGVEETLSNGDSGFTSSGNFVGLSFGGAMIGPIWDFRIYNRARPELGVELYDPATRWRVFEHPRLRSQVAFTTATRYLARDFSGFPLAGMVNNA